MSRLILILLGILTMGMIMARGMATARASAAWGAKADESLLAMTAGGATAEFLVVLREQADLSGAAQLRDKTERGRYVYELMTAVASRSQGPLRAFLDARGVTYRAYWVNNMLWVRGDRELLLTLAARGDVNHVYANAWQRVDIPAPSATLPSSRDDSTIEWNIRLVKAPQVWAEGYSGQGTVIGGQDTGYDWQHPALKNQYRGWDGESASHDYNWHDAIHEDFPQNGPGNSCGFDLAEPCDDDGHGTHTMGTMVGQTPGHSIGMAPGAHWIGCRNMENGWGSPATYSECFEWFMAPYPAGGDSFTGGDPAKAPHVINNSWSCPPVEGCAALDVLQSVVEAARAAGIVTVQSAGNSGSSCATISTPAAIYDASFTVGSTDANDEASSFSSRGPVTSDGSNRRKPDIVAPGSGILSSTPNDRYGSLSGTSMAAPHVAGLAALLISADPRLAGQVAELEDVITQSAVPLTSDQNCGDDSPTSVPNNVYGWGRIDALAAFESLGVESQGFDIFVPAFLQQ